MMKHLAMIATTGALLALTACGGAPTSPVSSERNIDADISAARNAGPTSTQIGSEQAVLPSLTVKQMAD